MMTCRLCGHTGNLHAAIELDTPAGTQLFSDDEKTSKALKTRITIVECPKCSLIQLTGDPVVYDHVSSSSSFVSKQLTEHRLAQLRKLFEMREASEGTGRMLEIGCGDGHLLETTNGLFEHQVGIEPTQHNVETAIVKKLDVHQMLMAQETVIPGQPFDYFCSFHVLEHVTDIGSFLQGVFNNLAVDAVGVIEVPATEAAIEHRRFGDFMPDHLNYFTTNSLRMALEWNGFIVEQIYRDWEGEHLVAYVRKRNGNSQSSLSFIPERQRNLQELVNIVNEREVPFVVWGASHHILPYLTILEGIRNLLVIDGSPSKINKFIPSTTLRVKPVSYLNNISHGYIAVAAPRFQNEIISEVSPRFASVNDDRELSDLLGFRILECQKVLPQ